MARLAADRDDAGLAVERTALAWNRTAASFVVVGAFALRLVAGQAVVVAAAVAAPAFVTAAVAWAYGSRRVAGQRRPPPWVPAAVAGGAALTGAASAWAWATTA